MSVSTNSIPTQEVTDRLTVFAEVIGSTVEVVKKSLSELIDFDRPDQALTLLDDENCLTFGDLAKIFVQTNICKMAVLRLGIKHLRGQTEYKVKTESESVGGLSELANAVTEMTKANRPIENWTDRELLERYCDTNPKVSKEISDRVRGRHCIIFTDSSETTVDIEPSLELMTLARKQQTPDKYRVQGRLRSVHRPGLFTEKPLDESPFYINVPLANGYCSESDTDWNTVSLQARQLIRIQIQYIEKAKLTQREMKIMCSDAKTLSWDKLTAQYPNAAIKFEELSVKDNLPKLKIAPQNARPTVSSGRAADTAF